MIMKCKEADRDFFLNHPILRNHISLLDTIKKTFQLEDNIRFIKAPGRVNLIGEHTDYNMGPVLPCAIDREIVFCLRENNSAEINVTNINPKFTDISFSINQLIQPYSKGYWGNYIKAGIKGVIDYLNPENHFKVNDLRGFDAIVSSTLPQAAGLSSSSALVVASALSFVIMNQFDVGNLKLAEICAKAEHFVGTAGGGMDQAASLLGKQDSFLKIEFNPLKISPITAPKDIQIVLFHSLVKAEKSNHLRDEYNRRVLECQMGVDLFNQFIMDQVDREYHPVEYIGEIKPERFSLNGAELNQLVSRFMNQISGSYNVNEISSALDLSAGELTKRYKIIMKSDLLKEPPGGFKIKGRFKHVYTECQRVNQAIECLHNNNMAELGDLLNASHKSLLNDYEVSIPEVDQLINLLLENGALGARLMGAGFGGMILTLTDESKKDQFIKKIKNLFYSHKVSGDINKYIFPCIVADGAGEL